MRGFIEECITTHHENEGVFTGRTDIYMAYTSWASMNGFHQMSAQRFYESFVAAMVDVSKYPVTAVMINGVRGYKNIKLR